MSNPYNEKAIINRAMIGNTQRVEPPANVERREFSGPCFYCGRRGECRHRSAQVRADAGVAQTI